MAQVAQVPQVAQEAQIAQVAQVPGQRYLEQHLLTSVNYLSTTPLNGN